MQHPGRGYDRPPLWHDLMEQVGDFPPQIRKNILQVVERWLKRQLEARCPSSMVLGAMLRDLGTETVGRPFVSDEERALALEVGHAMTQDLAMALERGELHRHVVVENVGAAFRDAVQDLAERADRCRRAEAIPISDTWGSHLEGEDLEVGMMLNSWVRSRLPAAKEERRRLFKDVLRGLQLQLAQECRQLRRLHMGVQQLYVMGEGSPPPEEVSVEGTESVPRQARDLVDQIIMIIGDTPRLPSVLALLGATSSATSSGSTSSGKNVGTFAQEGEALKRWLNGVFEASVRDLMEDLGSSTEEDLREQQRESESREEWDLVDDDTDTEMEDNALVQRERPESHHRSERPRSRSPRTTRPSNTWSEISASGEWRDGFARAEPGRALPSSRTRRPSQATGADDAHRPWRRMAPDGRQTCA